MWLVRIHTVFSRPLTASCTVLMAGKLCKETVKESIQPWSQWPAGCTQLPGLTDIQHLYIMWPQNIRGITGVAYLATLKSKRHHFDDIFATGCTVIWCYQEQKCENKDPFSMYTQSWNFIIERRLWTCQWYRHHCLPSFRLLLWYRWVIARKT